MAEVDAGLSLSVREVERLREKLREAEALLVDVCITAQKAHANYKAWLTLNGPRK